MRRIPVTVLPPRHVFTVHPDEIDHSLLESGADHDIRGALERALRPRLRPYGGWVSTAETGETLTVTWHQPRLLSFLELAYHNAVTGTTPSRTRGLEAGLLLHPDDPDLLLSLAHAYTAQHDYGRARRLLRRRLALLPGDPDALCTLGTIALREHAPASAAEHLERAAASGRLNARCYLLLAWVMLGDARALELARSLTPDQFGPLPGQPAPIRPRLLIGVAEAHFGDAAHAWDDVPDDEQARRIIAAPPHERGDLMLQRYLPVHGSVPRAG